MNESVTTAGSHRTTRPGSPNGASPIMSPTGLPLQRHGVLLPHYNSPAAVKMNRRFYHLGVERTDLPPRDAATLMDPECIAYIPEAPPGLNATHELQRSLIFNAHGSPPPKPHYYSDIDRCRHCAHPASGGGMDVGPHLIYRPSYQLAIGDYPHTPLYKELLTINMMQLDELRREASTPAHGSLDSKDGGSPPGQRRAGTSMSWSPSTRRLPSISPSVMNALVPSGDSTADPALVEVLEDASHPQESQQSQAIVGSPTRANMQSIRSLEVARRGSSLEATKQARRKTTLYKREKQLAALTRMGHPNQVTVYLPQ